ncbi:MAG TPA: TonB-dependent receptor [Woeseiaceae bacterium]|nr:TonB-dependent receptor [Woeseiaceae bacterium]
MKPFLTAKRTGARVWLTVGWLFCGAAYAATIDIAVNDTSERPRQGLSVNLKNSGTGFLATSVSNTAGRARFNSVPVGPGYSVVIDGIELASDIRLRSNETRAISVRLQDTITVTARRRALSINSLDAEVSATLNRRELEALPVEARDLSRALVRLPNVVPATGFYPEAPPVSINGANGLFTQYLIDGLDNNENFLGGPKFPISTGSVSDVTVLASSYSAEYGRSGNGIINVTTRSGSNNFTGEAFYLVRPGASLDSSSAFPGRDLSGNLVQDGFRRDQVGFSLGGPLQRDRTFFFANIEYALDQKDNRLNSPALGVNGVVPGENDSLLASIRLDHRANQSWQLMFRFNRGDIGIERQGGGLDGGVTFPSAGSSQQRISTLMAFSASYDKGDFASETSLASSHFDWDYAEPLEGGPQVTVLSPDGLVAAVLGHPGFTFDEREDSLQLQQKFIWLRGTHALSFGIDAMHSRFSLAGGGNPDGNYRVRLTNDELGAVRARNRGIDLAVDDLPLRAELLDYAVELRPAEFGEDQKQLALYVEDQLSLTQDLTLTAGLRWDYDSLTKAGAGAADNDNFAPRLALNWRVNERVALHAGTGLYYERLPYTIFSDALQQNTTSAAFQQQVESLIEAGILARGTDASSLLFDGNLTVNPDCPDGFLQCPTPAEVPDLRDTAISNERRILNPAGLDSPYTVQISAGLEWQISDAITGSAELLFYRGFNQLRVRDLNAPAEFSPHTDNLTASNVAALRALPTDEERRRLAEALGLIRSPVAADATRPVTPVAGGARQIVISETAGESRYKSLSVTLQKADSGSGFGYLLNYTLSELRNNTDDINFRAANSNRFDDEWGPSINDRRHVLSTVLYWYPLDSITVTLAGLYESGQPVNLIPDTGIYGTTDLNGDGASFSDAYVGNSDRSPGVSRNSERLPSATTFDLRLAYRPAIARHRLEFSADIFNLFDKTNLSGFANSATQSNQIQVAGQPFVRRNAAAPRQFQLGVRYVF